MLSVSQNFSPHLQLILDSGLPRKIVPTFILITLALLFSNHSSHAQSSSSVYWRYDAPDRLIRIHVTDLDRDGIDDFVVVAGDSDVVLVGADGNPRWSVPFNTASPIIDITTANVRGEQQSNQEIILITEAGLVILNSAGNQLFTSSLRDEPALVKPFRTTIDDTDDILLALSDGELRRIDDAGQIVWQFRFPDVNEQNAQPALLTVDLDRDGEDEIIYSYFTDEGFSKLVLLTADGEFVWERSNSGNVNALTAVEFDPEKPLEIALATNLDRIFLYSADGERRWPYRSPNKTITFLEPAMLDGTPALVVGT